MNAPILAVRKHLTHLDKTHSPELAVIIPVYKQPGLLVEALESIIAQRTRYQVRVVVIDDGCPFSQTSAIAQAYVSAFPGAIFHLRRANGGLSAARNTGIDFALDAWPHLRAIYFLDADNRIAPLFLERAMSALERAPDSVGWIYPDIDTFGVSCGHDTSGRYSVLFHLSEGLCEAGSLVRRSVLDTGIRFDEAMKLGFEDWEFWLQAIENGFGGQHLPNSGFKYRRRFESMLTNSERNRDQILSYIRNKHKTLYSAKILLKLEHEEMPRYCLVTEKSAYRFSDPTRRGTPMDSNSIWLSLLDLASDRGRVCFPPYMLYCSEADIDFLARQGLAHGLLCELEHHLNEVNLAGVIVDFNQPDGKYKLTTLDESASKSHIRDALLLAATSDLLCDCIMDKSSDWLTSITGTTPQPTIRLLLLSLPASMDHPLAADRRVYDLASTIDRLHALHRRLPPPRRPWRSFGFRRRNASHAILQSELKTGPVFPVDPNARNIAFILPLAEFGGVEKVAVNYAMAAHARGHRCHLFVFEAMDAFIPSEYRCAFDTITFLNDTFIARSLQPNSGESRVAYTKYLGTAPSRWAIEGDHRRALGLLIGMDVVVAMHSYEAHGLMGKLRHAGVSTFVGLHIADEHPMGYPTGHPLYMLPFEHSYDGVLVISEAMARWCIGHGVPKQKVIVVPNAPAYEADPAMIKMALERRREAHRTDTLNALFLGRLDYQKGLSRLREMVVTSVHTGMRLNWRIVGKAVVHDCIQDLAGLEPMIEPPATTDRELDALYSWADIVVLPSLYEGVPLTILEAQRFGCVVIATDVGAVSEVVRSGYDGVLVDNSIQQAEVVAGFLGTLRRLLDRPDERRTLSLNAVATAGKRNWSRSMEPFFNRIDQTARAA